MKPYNFTSFAHNGSGEGTNRREIMCPGSVTEERVGDYCSQRYGGVNIDNLQTEAGCAAIDILKDNEEEGGLWCTYEDYSKD